MIPPITHVAYGRRRRSRRRRVVGLAAER